MSWTEKCREQDIKKKLGGKGEGERNKGSPKTKNKVIHYW